MGSIAFVLKCLFIFIPAKNLGDTKTIFDEHATNLVMFNICSEMGSMCISA
jgi:hypothetical protein